MKTGSDYTGIGENYRKYRQGYSEETLKLLLHHVKLDSEPGKIADIGAGTGIWTRQMAEHAPNSIVNAVEPNDDMRNNGKIFTRELRNVEWFNGTGELTGLDDEKYNWVTMASAFHWTDPKKSLPEFYRILKKDGYLTLLWNPLVRENDEIQQGVESIILKHLPSFKRDFRSGEESKKIIIESGLFKDVIEIRHEHYQDIPVENYIRAWEAANHLRKEAEKTGKEVFPNILRDITYFLKDKEIISVPYQTRSWTARKK